MRIDYAVVGASLSLLLVSGPTLAQEPTLVVESGSVVIGDGTVLERASVIVAGERIVGVTEVPVQGMNVRRINAAGKTVLPGLIDVHVHLLIDPPNPVPPGTGYRHRAPPPTVMSDSLFRAYLDDGLPERLRSYLEAGVTTLRSTGDYWPEIVEVKASLLSGELTGPRLEVVGPVFTGPGHPSQMCRREGEWNDWCRARLVVQPRNPIEAREAVRRVAESGVDGIKMVGPDHGGVSDEAVIRAIATESDARGIPLLMHVYDPADALASLRFGVDQFVHAPILPADSLFSERLLNLMHENGTFATSTISINEIFRARHREAGRLEEAEEEAEEVRGLQRAARIYAQEGLLAFGTDVPMLAPEEGLRREIRLLSEAGLTPADVLRSMTVMAAQALGRAQDLGTLEPGKLADLIVVEGNPLDDLSALENVEVVVKGGEVVVTDG